MSRKDGSRLNIRCQILGDCPSNRKTIKGCCAATNFIEENERFGSGMIKDIGRFVHLYHERRLTCSEVIDRTNASENAIAYPQPCRRRRDKTPRLCHQLYQSHLPQIATLPTRIWSCENNQIRWVNVLSLLSLF